jgi:hypothetical protein
LSGSESVQVFLSFVYTMYMYILLENQLSRGGYEIPLTVLTPPHLCVCPKQGIGFPTSYVGVFFYVQ